MAKTKLKMVNFKATREEASMLKKIARRYTHGNVGGLIRQVCTNPQLLKTNRIRVRKVVKKAA